MATTTTKRAPKKYAEGTTTSVANSREEIERLLKRYNASGFLYGSQEDKEGGEVAAVAFQMQERRYRIEIRYPHVEQFRTPHRYSQKSLEEAREKEIMRLWRALTMVIKAKLEAVKSGIVTLENEMLAYTVMSNNQTVGEWIKPQVDEMYRSGEMPPLLPGVSTTSQHKQIGGSKRDVIEGEYTSS